MKKVFALVSYNLGLWGIIGFFATLLLSYLSCCAGLSQTIFYICLGLFAAMGLSATSICVFRACAKDRQN